MFDYGWIENAGNGSVVWRMEEPKTSHAGGARKNRKVDLVITLPAGNYKLRYKSEMTLTLSITGITCRRILTFGE